MENNRIELIERLDEFVTRFANILTLNELTLAVQNVIQDVLPVEYTALYMTEPDSGRLRLFFAKGLTEEERLEAERTAMERHPGKVIRSGETLYIPDVENDSVKVSIDSPRSFRVLSRLYIPVKSKDKTVGAFGIASQVKNRFTREDIALLTFITHLASSVYDNIMNHRTLIKAQKEIADISKLVEENPNPVMRVSCEGILDYANPASKELLEPRHCTVGDVIQGDIKDMFEEVIRENRIIDRELQNGDKYYLFTFTPQLGSGYVSVYAKDITPRVQITKDLQNMAEIAQEASRAKERFLANMSHEIRTPMNTVHGMTQLLASTKLDQEQKNYVEGIHLSSHNLLTIINDILDMSKIDAGELELQSAPFNLKNLIKPLIRSLEYNAVEKSLMLTYRIDDRIAPVLIGDSDRLNQIMLNLMGNAIKFTQSGYVKLFCDLEREDPLVNVIRFSIKDSGMGISNANLEKIFEPFKQEDESKTRLYGGTGLGLSISRQLVKLMGGELKVSSEKGSGSEFWFIITLPKGNEQDLIDVEKKAIINDTTLKGVRILLAEDNRFNQKILEINASKWNASLEIVDNGFKAFEILKDKKFDVVIMDKQMPIMDGVEATRKIRRELHLDIPILALTANVIKEVINECYDAGMDDYLSKPFEQEILFEKICLLLGKDVEYSVPEIQENLFDKNLEDIPDKDLYKLDSLRIMGSDPEFLRSSLMIFVRLTSEALEDLNEAFARKDFPTVERKAHFLKSNIYQLEIDSIKQTVLDIMIFAKDENKQEMLPPLIERLNIVLNKVVAKMKEDFNL